MKRTLPYLIVLALGLACKRDEKTSTMGAKLENTPTELRGTWVTECMPTATLGMAGSQREFVFNAIGDFDRIERYYSDPDCHELAATYRVVGAVNVTGQNPDKPDLEMINFTVNEADITAHTEAIRTELNRIKLCGRADWRVGEPIHVTNAACEGSKVQKGGVQFDSFDIKNGHLYLGSRPLFLAKDSASERPTELDMKMPFTKK